MKFNNHFFSLSLSIRKSWEQDYHLQDPGRLALFDEYLEMSRFFFLNSKASACFDEFLMSYLFQSFNTDL